MDVKGNVQIIEACLKSTTHLKETVITNICDGSVHTIPHGFGEYLVILLGMVFVLILLSVVVIFLKSIFE